MTRHNSKLGAAALLVALAACGNLTQESAPDASQAPVAAADPVDAGPKAERPAPPVPTIDTSAVFDSLPAPKIDGTAPYHFKEAVKVLPRAGEKAIAFPPADKLAPTAKPVPQTGPLSVTRHQPDGTQGITGIVSATFNQPMVPLTDLAQLKQESVPLQLEPLPEGTFRWLGTSTVEFEAKDRLPFATTFHATIPAGAKSELGATLAKPVTWTFSTPRPHIDGFEPNGNDVEPSPLIHASFNQAVSPQQVAEQLACVANGKRVPLQLAKPEQDPFEHDTSSDVAVKRRIFEERNIFLKPVQPFPLDTDVVCTLPKGFRGGEGPDTTQTNQAEHFRTYGPLKFVQLRCGWQNRCPPATAWSAQFNNAIDDAQDFAKRIRVDPKVDDLVVSAYGNNLTFEGSFRPSTHYTVTFDSALADRHKQTLGKDVSATVDVGPADPMLALPSGNQLVIERDGPRMLPLSFANLKKAQVRYFRVEPARFFDALNAVNRYVPPEQDPFAGWSALATRMVDLGPASSDLSQVGLALDEPLGKNGTGMLIADVSSDELRQFDRYSPTHRMAIVQVTDLGITAHLTDAKAVVLVTSFSSGKPVAGAHVTLLAAGGKVVSEGQTDAHGIAEIDGPTDRGNGKQLVLTAEKADDRATLDCQTIATGSYLSSYNGGSGFNMEPTIAASVFTDRAPYRPGDTVHLAGVVRAMTHGTTGRVEPIPSGTPFHYTVTDARGQKFHEGKGALGPSGMFSVDIALPGDVSLGTSSFEATLDKAGAISSPEFGTSFDVEEFRTPEYKVSIDTGEPLHFVNQTLKSKVVGEFFFGGGMSGAQATWTVRRSQGYFSPPHAPSGYTFSNPGPIVPFYEFGYPRPSNNDEGAVANGSGALDALGRLPFDVKLDPGKLEGPVSFQITANVVDTNRQNISANTTVLAHAGNVYPGIKLDKTVLKAGESVLAQVVALDVDGKPSDPSGSKVELVERTWDRKKSPNGGWSYEQKESVVSSCTLASTNVLGAPSGCKLIVDKAGEYLVRVHAVDAQKRTNTAAASLYAYGKNASPWWKPQQNLQVELVPDQDVYAPGATAHVLIRSPFPHSTGILGIDREGLVEYRPLEFDGPMTTVDVPLNGAQVPNVSLMVGLVRGRISPDEAGAAEGDPDDAGRPMYAGGELSLTISTKEHELNVSVTPSKPAIEPGGTLDLRVQTQDGNGKVTSAKLVVAVVDEGVLSLENYALPNPLGQIIQSRGAEAGNVAIQPLVIQRQKELKLKATRPPRYRTTTRGKDMQPGATATAAPAPAPPAEPMAIAEEAEKKPMKEMLRLAGNAGPAQAPPPKLTARTLFKSTAFFTADAQTNAQGTLEMKIPMPENLTRYRVMVVAVGEGDRYGQGDGSVQVRKSLMVRPALPRFLNLGDQFLASGVITNQTDEDLWVDAQARAANGSVDAKRTRVLVRAGESSEVAFDAKAGVPGVSRWQIAAVALNAARSSDAAELDVPVELPATSEAFATYGATDKTILQPVVLPKDALPDFGGLEVSLSSTALTGLADAVAYLHDYPYECVEQTSSRILPFVALKDVITDFHIAGAGTTAQRDGLVKAGIDRILSKQRGDGGFGYWSDSRDSYLYVSAWAGYVMHRAKVAGFAVDDNAMRRLTSFLTYRLQSPRHDLGEDTDYDSQAMAALVLGQLGSPQPAMVKRIFGKKSELAIDGKAWLMQAAHESLGANSPEESELNRELQNSVVEKASSAHFIVARSESLRLLMHSNDRTDAIVLASFIAARPKDPLIPKIVHGLNESRRHGRWDTTQSNAWATVAMGDYYAAFEKAVPNFSAKIFVGEMLAGATQFKGRSAATDIENIPLAAISKLKSQDLTLAKEGPGRLYYRLGLRYAPQSLKLAPEEQGFAVTRTYLPMDDAPGTVTTDADGTVHIKPGADVKVKLQIVVSDRAEFVAVDDPLPAGLEAVNTRFQTAQDPRIEQAQNDRSERTRTGWWWGWWWNPFNHEELKDDRVLLFADQLPAGVYTHTYVARATTKGTFQVPPARALEMYEPENFGRTASTVVSVQ